LKKNVKRKKYIDGTEQKKGVKKVYDRHVLYMAHGPEFGLP